MRLDERAAAAGVDRGGAPAPWLRNAWYAAAWSANVGPGTILSRTILGEPLVFFRGQDGALTALADYCPHRFAPLNIGKLLPNGRLQCGYHGLEFDASGRCVHNPHGEGAIPPAAAIPAYPVRERYGVAWIWMGNAPPDDGIAEYGMFDDVPPLYASRQDYLMVNAPYTLVQDNLMDTSHASYVHAGVLGNAEMIAAAKPELEQLGDQVVIRQSSDDVPVPKILDLQYRSNGRRADKWNSVRWDPPGSLLIFGGVKDCGAERGAGTGFYGMHLLTPETETSTHYHFWAVRWNVRDPDEATSRSIIESMNVLRRRAFEEQDAPIIEAQTRVRARLGEAARPALLSVDAAAVRARRVLDRRIAREAEPA